jgi:hypothetical protein
MGKQVLPVYAFGKYVDLRIDKSTHLVTAVNNAILQADELDHPESA